MQREKAVGASFREAVWKSSRSLWAEQKSKRNGYPPLSGQAKKFADECGFFPNTGGTADSLFALFCKEQNGAFCFLCEKITEEMPSETGVYYEKRIAQSLRS